MFLGTMVAVQAQAKAQTMATGQAPSLQKQASLHSPPPLAQWYQEALVHHFPRAQSSRALHYLPAVSLYRLA